MTRDEAIEQLRRLAELRADVQKQAYMGSGVFAEETDFVYEALDTDWPALLAAVEGARSEH